MRGRIGVAEWNVPGFTELKTLGSGGFGDVVLDRGGGHGDGRPRAGTAHLGPLRGRGAADLAPAVGVVVLVLAETVLQAVAQGHGVFFLADHATRFAPGAGGVRDLALVEAIAQAQAVQAIA
jgi:DNA-binding transcriptional LysR family regulator